MRIILLSMPDTVHAFRRWRPPNLAVSSITVNLRGHDVYMEDMILARNKLTSSIKNLPIEYKPEVIDLNAVRAKRVILFINDV
jgi:anaerobic magnesium-protoporphyrin IX monomethyl ester cyclase